jgi:hypothetical protein
MLYNVITQSAYILKNEIPMTRHLIFFPVRAGDAVSVTVENAAPHSFTERYACGQVEPDTPFK